MKKLILALLIIFTYNSYAQKQNLEDTLLQLSKRKFNWMIDKKLDSLSAVLDENVRYVHSNGWIQNKNEIIEDFKTEKLILKNVDIDSASIRIFGSTAIIIGNGKFKGVINSNEFEVHLLYTEVYCNHDNHWYLVSRHANKL